MTGQNLLIHEYLKKGNRITQNEALSMFGIGRLASRVNDLKTKFGVPIESETITVQNRSGKNVYISQYFIAQKEEQLTLL